MPNGTSSRRVSSTAQIADGVIQNADVNASAAIDKSKLNLTGTIENADIKTSAGIDDSKLAEINDADKVSGAAFKALDQIPAGAGVIPSANLPASVLGILSTFFEDTGRFTESQGGGGSGAYNTDGFAMQTSNTSGSYAKILLQAKGDTGQIYNGSPRFYAAFYCNNLNAATNQAHFYIGLGDITVAGTGITFTNRHIGFKIVKGSGVTRLYATQGDNTTENASTFLSACADGDTFEVFLKVNSSTSVDYYWRKNGGSWSSATNLTSNMPTVTTNDGRISAGVSNVSTATGFDVTLNALNYQIPIG